MGSKELINIYHHPPHLTIRPPHIDPPQDAQAFDWQGSLIIPAEGATATILQFTVPRGLNGMIKKIGNQLSSGGVDGSGAFSYAILHDNKAFRYYNKILFSLGLVTNPVEHPLGLRVLENQVISFTFTNVGIIPAGEIVNARMQGYYYPKEFDDPSIRIVQ
jgi:hypothetical protein